MIAIPLSWNVTDKNGGPLPEGTKIKVTVNAIPEYNWDRATKTVKGTLGAGASWTTELTVDNTAPELTGASYTRDFVTGESSLRVTAKDNRYVAAILVTNARQTEILARQAVNQTELGVESTVTVDTSGVTGSEVCVIAVDYAGNMAGYKIKLNGSEEEEIDADSFYANNAYDSSWIAFKAGSMDTAKTVGAGARSTPQTASRIMSLRSTAVPASASLRWTIWRTRHTSKRSACRAMRSIWPTTMQTASCTSCARRTACTPSTRLWAHWRWSAPSRCPPA